MLVTSRVRYSIDAPQLGQNFKSLMVGRSFPHELQNSAILSRGPGVVVEIIAAST